MTTNTPVLTRNDAPTGTGCLMAVAVAIVVLAVIVTALVI